MREADKSRRAKVRRETHKPSKVCVLSFGRSGTNLLLSRILASDEILVGWEPFNDTAENWFEFWKIPTISPKTQLLLHDSKLRARDPKAFFNRISGEDGTLAKNPEVKAVLFKIFPMHSLWAYRTACTTPGVRIIFVTRANVLELYASHRSAYQTKQYTLSKGQQSIQTEVEFDPLEFEVFSAYQAMMQDMTVELLAARGEPWLAYDYLEIADPDFDLDPIFDFCGVSRVASPPSWLKKQGKPLASTFSNMDEVHRYFTEVRPQWIHFLR